MGEGVALEDQQYKVGLEFTNDGDGRLKSNGYALKGLKVSNIGGGKEALQEHAMNDFAQHFASFYISVLCNPPETQ